MHALAGQPAPASALIDLKALLAAYHDRVPDPAIPAQRVAFGTSGHRGCALDGSFNEAHVLAISQAICEWRKAQGIDGPLFLGVDTHALSEPARRSAVEVLVANGVDVRVDAAGGYTPTPVISHAILGANRGRDARAGGTPGSRADGIVITPSHNPPRDGGFKYNPPHGGPAGTEVTGPIQARANELLAQGLAGVKRRPGATGTAYDYVTPYVEDLGNTIDLGRVRAAGLRLGADPLGGSGVAYWGRIAERWGLNIEVVDDTVDPRFAFMSLDHDGKIRMDCSSPPAMARLIGLRERFDLAFGNDPDFDRHGIVTRSRGLMPPNQYLSVAIDHLFRHRPGWSTTAGVGKTLVSSAMIDRVAADLGRPLVEVPVGFKWFVEGLSAGTLGFGGEESAGASFLRRDGGVWTTDKDGILLCLLAAEQMASSGRDPGEAYAALEARFGTSYSTRVDTPVDDVRKAALGRLSPADVKARTLGGQPIVQILTHAPGNGAAIGGLKVQTADAWFAARPSGTEAIAKLYAESFVSAEHLAMVVEEAQVLLAGVGSG